MGKDFFYTSLYVAIGLIVAGLVAGVFNFGSLLPAAAAAPGVAAVPTV